MDLSLEGSAKKIFLPLIRYFFLFLIVSQTLMPAQIMILFIVFLTKVLVNFDIFLMDKVFFASDLQPNNEPNAKA